MSKTRNAQFPTIVSNRIHLPIHTIILSYSLFISPQRKLTLSYVLHPVFFVFHLFKELLEGSLLTMDNTQTAPEVSFAQYGFLTDNGKQTNMLE